MKQCNYKTVMMLLHRGRFVIVNFQLFLWSVDPTIFDYGQIYHLHFVWGGPCELLCLHVSLL